MAFETEEGTASSHFVVLEQEAQAAPYDEVPLTSKSLVSMTEEDNDDNSPLVADTSSLMVGEIITLDESASNYDNFDGAMYDSDNDVENIELSSSGRPMDDAPTDDVHTVADPPTVYQDTASHVTDASATSKSRESVFFDAVTSHVMGESATIRSERTVHFDAAASRATTNGNSTLGHETVFLNASSYIDDNAEETISESDTPMGDRDVGEADRNGTIVPLTNIRSMTMVRLSMLRQDHVRPTSLSLRQSRTAAQLERTLCRSILASPESHSANRLLKEELRDVFGKATALIGLGSKNDEGKPLSAGFVTFTSLSATNAALQLVHSRIPSKMTVMEAPSPEAIIWSNVGMTPHAVQVGKLVSAAMTTALIMFWTIPVTAIVSLTNASNYAFLEELVVREPWLELVFKQIAPLTLAFINGVVLPLILTIISRFEGDIGTSYLESNLFSKMALFQVNTTSKPIDENVMLPSSVPHSNLPACFFSLYSFFTRSWSHRYPLQSQAQFKTSSTLPHCFVLWPRRCLHIPFS
jgi:hypothetical protein